MRADQDLGPLIIKEMLERLYFSDLVVADLSIPNGNVYYEVGIRHAAKDGGCVLVSADWARPLFDMDQMRQIRYPLPEGEISDGTAAAIRESLTTSIPALATSGSPMYETLEGYPANVRADRARAIADFLDELAAFQEATRRVPFLTRLQQADAARAVRDQHGTKRPIVAAVAVEPSICYAISPASRRRSRSSIPSRRNYRSCRRCGSSGVSRSRSPAIIKRRSPRSRS